MAGNSFEAEFGMLLGFSMLAMFLFGITALQTWFYFRKYDQDGPLLRRMSALLLLLDAGHMVIVCHYVYNYVVRCHPLPPIRHQVTSVLYPENVGTTKVWSIPLQMTFNLMISIITQCFFARQIYLSCSWNRMRTRVVIAISILVLLHFSFGIVVVINFFLVKTLAQLQDVPAFITGIFAIAAILADVTISGMLCAMFWNIRPDVRRMKSTLDRLMIYAINRCILTTLVCLIELIVFDAAPSPVFAVAIDFLVGKLYINTYFAALNSRSHLRHGMENNILSSIRITPTFPHNQTQEHSEYSMSNTPPERSETTSISYATSRSTDDET